MRIYLFISAILNILTSAFLGVWVYLKDKKSKVNRIFAIFCLSGFIWSFGYIFFPLSLNKNLVLFSFQTLHMGAFFIPVTFFHFVSTWFESDKKYKKIIISGYATAFILSYFAFSPLFIKNIEPKFSMPLWANPGPFYYFYLLFFYFYALFALYILVSAFKKSIGIKREQIKFILIGMVISYIGGSTNYPLWFNINIPPYGNILASAFIICSAYAILKYRFMDIRVVIRKSAVNIGSMAILMAGIIPLNFIIIKNLSENSHIIASIVEIFLSVALYSYIKRRFKKIINKYFFSSLYDERDLLIKISADLQNILDENQLFKYIADIIDKTFHSSKILIAIRSGSKFIVEFSDIRNPAYQKNILEDDEILEFLDKESKIIVFNEAQKKYYKKFSNALDKMKRHKIELIIPLKSNKNFIGALLLGEKYNREVYSKEDIQILEIISRQFAVTLENALLYKEVQDFNELLGRKIKEQTDDLQKKNIELNKLLNMRTEFLNTASHQLRTPISIIQGTASILSNSNYRISADEQREMLRDILYGADKMRHIIDNILRAASYDTDKNFSLNLLLERVSLKKCSGKIIKEFKIPAEEKNISIKFKYPKNLPDVKSSESHLCQIISNLLDNAIMYALKGGKVEINLSFNKESNKARFQIKDSGIGISKDELPNIFDKFTRGNNALSVNADGSGLGLFIARQLVNAHPGGEIGIESKISRGTEVWFELEAVVY